VSTRRESIEIKPHLAEIKGDAADDPLRQRVRSLRLPQHAAQRSSNTRVPWVLCLLLALSTAALGYAYWSMRLQQGASAGGTANGKPAGQSTNSAQAEKANATSATGDATAMAKAGENGSTAAAGQIALEAKGYIVPAHQILVSPKISGMIVRLRTADGEPLQEGKRVKKDEVLAELEDTDYQADLARAKALLESAKQRWTELDNGSRAEEIREAKAEVEEAKTQQEQLHRDYERAQRLMQTTAVSKEEFEQTKSKLDAMQQRVERLKNASILVEKGARDERRRVALAEIQQAEADVAKAQWRLDNCKIRAPVTGTILKKNAEEGNVVNPIAFNGSFSLCEMADLSDLEVDLTIQERDISHIFKGQKCQIRTEAFPDRMYNGVVSRLMPIADRAKGAIPVRVKVSVPAEEEGVYLKPEMGAIVSFLKKE
jgi:HlyD family secretion protein